MRCCPCEHCLTSAPDEQLDSTTSLSFIFLLRTLVLTFTLHFPISLFLILFYFFFPPLSNLILLRLHRGITDGG